jgi:hypothetical protein
MRLKVFRFLVLMLAALTLGMKFAHVLELLPKLGWDANLYIAVQTSLYQVFGSLGPIIDIGAILTAFLLAAMVRRRPAFRYTLFGALAMLLSLGVWLIIVAPANRPINEWQASGIVPTNWMELRSQWQYGQAGSFVFDLIGFSLLLIGVIQETPNTNTAPE